MDFNDATEMMPENLASQAATFELTDEESVEEKRTDERRFAKQL